ncbi:peptidase inhibitor family I36 protein [Aeromicrobium ginsengisoli]|uniref:Peptidase inhibitor family I36 protein n=1 Tax=Aeromicrobium ginsengisoli TaxID=363867 RepID=A0A5M4FHQ5_9ACTN|nr:peptidase inhibitor family I36 protein [Aeromicrobium ginsengisoli]KAA1399581.1 hypothetical protein ESP70_002105 [Aeromicrobium ginsengisoli]
MKTTRFISVIVTTIVLSTVAPALSSSASAAVSPSKSLSQCDAGYLCIWSGTNYSGSFQRFSATGSYRPISLYAVNSIYNHRSARAFLHQDAAGNGYYTCLNPGQKIADLVGWRESSQAVYLSTVAAC